MNLRRESRSQSVEDALQRHGLDDNREGCHVYALLQVCVDDVVHPMLTMSGTEREQLQYWQDVADASLSVGDHYAYRFKIVRAHPLAEPMPLQFVTTKRLRGLIITLEDHQTPSLLAALQHPLPTWTQTESPSTAIRTPPSYALLCSARVWRSIVLPHCPSFRAQGGRGSSALEISWSALNIPQRTLPTRPQNLHIPPDLQLDSRTATRSAYFLREYAATLNLEDEFEQ